MLVVIQSDLTKGLRCRHSSSFSFSPTHLNNNCDRNNANLDGMVNSLSNFVTNNHHDREVELELKVERVTRNKCKAGIVQTLWMSLARVSRSSTLSEGKQ